MENTPKRALTSHQETGNRPPRHNGGDFYCSFGGYCGLASESFWVVDKLQIGSAAYKEKSRFRLNYGVTAVHWQLGSTWETSQSQLSIAFA